MPLSDFDYERRPLKSGRLGRWEMWAGGGEVMCVCVCVGGGGGGGVGGGGGNER